MTTRASRATVLACLLVGRLLAGCSEPTPSPAADGRLDCADVAAFASQLVDVATDYDYDPSTGPRELADRVDVVLQGRLTGNSSVQGEYLGYELGDVEVIAGAAPEANTTATVSVAFNPFYRLASSHQDAIVPGIPIIAFADRWDGLPGGLIASLPEGFMTACEGRAPVGWTVDYEQWGEMDSLEDIAEAVQRPHP